MLANLPDLYWLCERQQAGNRDDDWDSGTMENKSKFEKVERESSLDRNRIACTVIHYNFCSKVQLQGSFINCLVFSYPSMSL